MFKLGCSVQTMTDNSVVPSHVVILFHSTQTHKNTASDSEGLGPKEVRGPPLADISSAC